MARSLKRTSPVGALERAARSSLSVRINRRAFSRADAKVSNTVRLNPSSRVSVVLLRHRWTSSECLSYADIWDTHIISNHKQYRTSPR